MSVALAPFVIVGIVVLAHLATMSIVSTATRVAFPKLAQPQTLSKAFPLEMCWREAARARGWTVVPDPTDARVVLSKQSACHLLPAGTLLPGQVFNHVQNENALSNKLSVLPLLRKHAPWVHVPKTYTLNTEKGVLALVDACVDDPSSRWVLKVSGVDNGRGIRMATGAGALRVLETQSQFDMACELIHPPLLVHGRKCDFRLFVLLVPLDHGAAYVYSEFMTRVSAHQYSMDNADSLLTISTGDNRTDADWDRCQLSPARLDAETGRPGLAGDVFAQACEIARGIAAAAAAVVPRDTNRYALFGLDALMDADGRLWFIELNSSPQMSVGGAGTWKRGLNARIAADMLYLCETLVTSPCPHAFAKAASDTAFVRVA